MRGAYWAGGVSPAIAGAVALNSPEIKAAAACADLFRKTRFSRLEPHQEMLGGPEESPADRRRRKKAEAEAARLKALTAPASDATSKPPAAQDAQPPTKDKKALTGPDTAAKDTDGQAKSSDAPTKAVTPSPVFVLADPAWEYVIYFENGGTVMLDLLEATGHIKVLWLNPRTGEYSPEQRVLGGAYSTFTAPNSSDWVLYLSRR